MRTFRTGIAALLAVLAVWAPAARTATPAQRADLHKLARSLVKGGAPGAVVLVRSPTGVRSAASGVASRAPRVSMQASDDYRIASVTKTFVATVVLQLEAEGRLKIDDPVERWLQELVPNGSSITLRQLLNHTSGLFNYTDDEAFLSAVIAAPGQSWSPRELLSVAFAHPANFPPGTNWSYSNTNYVLLGLVIEAVTGRQVEQEFRDRIFAPLGLAATSFPAGISADERFAHGYASLAGSPLIDVTSLLSPSWA